MQRKSNTGSQTTKTNYSVNTSLQSNYIAYSENVSEQLCIHELDFCHLCRKKLKQIKALWHEDDVKHFSVCFLSCGPKSNYLLLENKYRERVNPW